MKKIFVMFLFSIVSVFAYEELNMDNFEQKIKGKNVIVDFYAVWCPPCKTLASNLQEFDVIKPDNVEIYKVNIDDELLLAKKHGVSKLPTLLYFKDGKKVGETIGVLTPQELLEASKQNFN